jgi:diguanylate cyclase (GGDEF)-like protein
VPVDVYKDQERFTVTASVGIAGLDHEDVDDGILVKRADEALYQAKEGGRNRVMVSDSAKAPAKLKAI